MIFGITALAQTTAGDVAKGANAQATQLKETAVDLQQMSASIKSNSASVGKARELARSSVVVAESGHKVVARAAGAMQQIDARSQEIVDVIGLVDVISFQINLLSTSVQQLIYLLFVITY